MKKEEEEDELQYLKEQPKVGWFALYQFSPTKYKIYLAIGFISAIVAGLSMPIFIIFLSDLYNSFDPSKSSGDAFGKLTLIS